MQGRAVDITVGGEAGVAGLGRERAYASGVLPPPDPARPVRSLYIHTPFCVHKCHYCDFFSFVDDGNWGPDVQSAFVERLCRELSFLAHWAAGAPLRTVFVGGGTPSLLRVELWDRLLGVIRDRFDLSLIDAEATDCWGKAEFTVECNPESASPALMERLRMGGVTRVSVGAQSFEPRHLKTLDRTHNPENVAKALENARAAGIARRSLDMIYAVPGQTLEEWGRDLDAALSIGTTHLSCYNLTYEPSTQMTARLRRGEFEPVDEEAETAMFELTTRKLALRGLERYEVSNYAVPGDESRHNLAYWLQEEWLAAGPSASGHVGGVRTKNVGNLRSYLESGESDGGSPLSDHEPSDPARAVRERLMTGVRLSRGVDASVLADAERVSPGSGERLQRIVAELRSDGLLAVDPQRLRVSGERGWLLADWIAKRLMSGVTG